MLSSGKQSCITPAAFLHLPNSFLFLRNAYVLLKTTQQSGTGMVYTVIHYYSRLVTMCINICKVGIYSSCPPSSWQTGHYNLENKPNKKGKQTNLSIVTHSLPAFSQSQAVIIPNKLISISSVTASMLFIEQKEQRVGNYYYYALS